MTDSKKILAKFDEKTITVYQAYSNEIADEAIEIGTFGQKFSLDRMSWIKTSFRWMMYRSAWGKKEGQERILSIEISRQGFDEILEKAVLSKYRANIYTTRNEWKHSLKNSDVRCQWDPERDIYGNIIDKKAIQLGIRGNILERYVNEYICNINDISEEVYKLEQQIKEGTLDISLLPKESVYPVSDSIKKKLDI